MIALTFTMEEPITYNLQTFKKQIEERVEAKYLKRIEYLVNANNELMYELEQCELECYGRGYNVCKTD